MFLGRVALGLFHGLELGMYESVPEQITLGTNHLFARRRRRIPVTPETSLLIFPPSDLTKSLVNVLSTYQREFLE